MSDRLPIHALDTIGADATNDTPRYNPATGRLEYAPGGNNPSTIREALLANTSGAYTLTLGATPITGTPMVWVNSVLLWPGAGYTITGPEIVFTSSLTSGDDVWVSYQTTDPAPVASTLIPTADNYAAAVLADAPLGYWRLGEASGSTAADASGNSRNGTYNAVTLGTAGLIGGTDTAATFNGTSSRVDIPLAGMDTGDLTVEAWFKTSTAAKRQIVSRWSNGAGASGQRWTLQLETSGNPYFYCLDGGYHSVGIATSKADGLRHHLAVTIAGNAITMYLDGAQVATGSKSGTLYGATSDVRIGSSLDPGEFFNGVIDEPAIYGTALSLARIQDHYNAGL